MIEIKRRALDDLREIADYIAEDDPERAERYFDELLDRIASIGENPLLYRVRHEWHRDLRIAPYGSYQILFRASDGPVVILRVAHSSRDLSSLLDELG